VSDAALPPGVRALLRGPVSTMAHVEALLLLHRVRPEPRPVAEIAEAAQLATLPAARRCLEDLVAGGLVAADGRDGYRYAPADADASAAVEALAQMYNEKPVTLVRAIYSRPAPVQAFADAFRLRKDES
jgi:hypothetical protein